MDFPQLPTLFDDQGKQRALAQWYYSLKQTIQRKIDPLVPAATSDSEPVMATTTKQILGQSAPSRGVLTTLYVCPPHKLVEDAKVTVANRSKNEATFRVSIAPLGAADASKHYVAYDVALEGGNSRGLEGIDLITGDAVRVYSGNGQMSFTLSGAPKDTTE